MAAAKVINENPIPIFAPIFKSFQFMVVVFAIKM
jgi:hypothetical protein